MPIVGHGVDLTPIARIERLLDEHGDRFVRRVFTSGERALADERSEGGRAEVLAGRFAAKEAALKALGVGLTGGVRWTDVETLRDARGRPVIRLAGAAVEHAARIGARRWIVSISHAAGSALASVIAEGD